MEDFLYELIDLIQAIADGVLFGSTYALIGIGFTLIFGAMEKLNMAYAASSIAGAYAGLALLSYFDVPATVVFFAAIPASGLVCYVVYLTCFRFIPRRDEVWPRPEERPVDDVPVSSKRSRICWATSLASACASRNVCVLGRRNTRSI